MDAMGTIQIVVVAIVAAGGGYAYLRWSSRRFDAKFRHIAPLAPQRRTVAGE